MLFSPLFERYAPRYLTAVANAVWSIRNLKDSEHLAAGAGSVAENTPNGVSSKEPKEISVKSSASRSATFDEIRSKLQQLSN